MRKLLFCVVGIALAGSIMGTAFSWRPCRRVDGPGFFVDQFEREAVLQAGRFTASFLVQNQGNGNLRLHAVDSTCGLRMSALEADTLRPNQSVRLFLELKPPLIGRRTAQLTMETNDRRNPRVMLSVDAETERPVPFVVQGPSTTFLQGLAGFAPDCRYLEVHACERGDESPWFTGLDGEIPGVEASLLLKQVIRLEDQRFVIRRYIVQLCQVNSRVVGVSEGSIGLRTRPGTASVQRRVQVFSTLEAPIRSLPSVVVFHQSSSEAAGRSCRHSVSFWTAHGVGRWQLKGILCDADWLGYERKNSTDPNEPPVIEFFQKRPTEDVSEATVTVRTTSTVSPELSVKVVAAAHQGASL